MSQVMVSIITPCFNSAKTIEKTIQSVTGQNYADMEYIIVDWMSEDNSAEIISRYQAKYPDMIRLISERDAGVYDAMNKGIRAARGKIIGIVNSDDWLEQNAVKTILKAMSDFPYEILYGAVKIWNDSLEVKTVLCHHSQLKTQMMMHPGCFVKREVYEKYGMFHLQYHYSADYEFMLRMAGIEEVKFIPVYAVVSNFRMGGLSSSDKAVRETAAVKWRYKSISRRRYIRIMSV